MLTGALLGAGNIARNGHLPAYLRSSEVRSRLRITAVADFCPENLAAVSSALPGVRPYADPEALIAAERPDFVDICAPPYAHHDLIALAAGAGCHILCEKPLTTKVNEALRLRDDIAERRLVVFPCHQYHYAPQWRAVRQVMESGEIGAITLGLVTVQRVGANPGNAAWIPEWRTDLGLAGGGILVDHGTHLFYQLHSLFGPPAEIACRTERRLPYLGVDDTATINLRYTNGRDIRIHLTWAAQARYSSHRYAGALGEVALLDDQITVRSPEGARRVLFAEGMSAGSAHSDWFAPLLIEFAGRIAARDYRLDRLNEAVATAAYITTSYASAAENGRPIAWMDPLLVPVSDGHAAAG
ncbi:MAG TPA: Gfo/Idh/MocA family oxidoreductase [Dehalococcoidia bacterium]